MGEYILSTVYEDVKSSTTIGVTHGLGLQSKKARIPRLQMGRLMAGRVGEKRMIF
jgi:hypothetical protein